MFNPANSQNELRSREGDNVRRNGYLVMQDVVKHKQALVDTAEIKASPSGLAQRAALLAVCGDHTEELYSSWEATYHQQREYERYEDRALGCSH
ncbi:hypothetical protein DPMN_110870 [Dreissena polymorpha]|uniref:Uncharacterized protein n=1 Tax=Dreissena polymorpha TaxID=45954 RepID=A0A9D4QNG9_DREPO|nr:hypothetical protein DPMN_110870 [Dreissena polymorpha]